LIGSPDWRDPSLDRSGLTHWPQAANSVDLAHVFVAPARQRFTSFGKSPGFEHTWPSIHFFKSHTRWLVGSRVYDGSTLQSIAGLFGEFLHVGLLLPLSHRIKKMDQKDRS
jgi:hypothetical protein